MKDIKIGASFTKEIVVEDALLANRVGSGEVSVYATPMMIALMEGAASQLLKQYLAEGETSVGSFLSTSHLSPTPIGIRVKATAEITKAEGKRVTFSIRAEDEAGLIGEGIHERFVLNREKFEQKAASKLGK